MTKPAVPCHVFTSPELPVGIQWTRPCLASQSKESEAGLSDAVEGRGGGGGGRGPAPHRHSTKWESF